MDKLGDLSDQELLARLRGHVGKGNVWCAKLITYLVEVDERRLDRVHACSSMWDFCTRRLRMSEGEAHRRIAAARTVRRFPQVLGYIERGEVHLCALYALRKHLTTANVDELLREASGKSTRDGRTSYASTRSEITTRAPSTPVRMESPANDPAAPLRSETKTLAPDGLARVETTAGDSTASSRSEVKTFDPDGFARVETIASDPTARMRSKTNTHAPGSQEQADTPSGSQGVSRPGPANAEPSTAERAASTPATKPSRPGSRYVPTELRREVFARDGERCSYVGPDGDRCPARGYLELDHVHPKARGGTETAANLRVRCRAHNALYGEQVFGRVHVRHRKSAPPTRTSFETAAQGLRALGFREPEARRALETLATTHDMEGATIETLLREALLVLT